MRSVGVALLILAIAAGAAMAGAEARLGSGFADAYAAFAPLESLYRSFADHLFAGTAIVVPAGIGTCCSSYLSSLDALQQEMVVQTASTTGEVLDALVRLRVAAEAMCADFQTDLQDLGEGSAVSPETRDRLVSERFFARIGDLDEEFERALDAALVGAGDGEPRWVMSVTFAVRALLVGEGWTRVAADTAVILFGSPESPSPPFAVSPLVGEAMAYIASAVGRELSDEEVARVRESAGVIYDEFIAD